MLIAIILILAFLSTGVLELIQKVNATGEAFAEVTYAGEPIIKINLRNPEEYQLYNTSFKNQINTDLAKDGIFYVPGETTVQMDELYKTDVYAKENNIVGIKLQVKDGKISVVYQESPKDLCQFEPPTNSSLDPIVCLPNKVVIRIITSQTNDDLIIDGSLE